VPKYDAFGREIGEDTLQGLGNASSEPEQDWREMEPVPAEPPRPDPQPAPAEPAKPAFVTKDADEAQRRAMAAQLGGMLQQAATARTSGAQPTITVRRSGSAKGCLVAIVVVLLIGGAVLAGVVSFVSSVSDEVGKIKLPEIATTGPAPKGLAGQSLMRPAAFSAALAKLRADESTKLTHVRIAPERIDAQLLTDEGRLRSVQFTPGGEMKRLGPDSGPGFDTAGTIPYARLRPGAPARLARQGAKKIGVPVSTVQYAVPTYSSSELTWAVYFEHARYVIGDARGRFQRAYP
jgi:hypothetical protein